MVTCKYWPLALCPGPEVMIHTVYDSPKTSRVLGLLTLSLCVAEGWALRKAGGILLQTARDNCAGLCETVCSALSLFLPLYFDTAFKKQNKTPKSFQSLLSLPISPALPIGHAPSPVKL